MTADIAYAIAILASSALAWDGWRRHITERSASRVSNTELLAQRKRIAELSDQLEASDDIRNKLATDWKQKFSQLELDWKQLRDHANSQFSGTLAQLESQQRRGFGR